MDKNNTLRENIMFLLDQYEKELKIEKNKSDQNYDIIECFENIVIELEFALKISRRV